MSNRDVKLTSTSGKRPMSHASTYRRKAAEKDKFPALKLDADTKAETFSYVLNAPEHTRPAMRARLADAFNKTFSKPGKLKSPSTVMGTVGRFGDRLEKLLDTFEELDAQERSVAEVVFMIGDSDFDLSNRMEELAHLGRNFREKLEELRAAHTFPRTSGPEFDPRIRTLVLLLAPIYRRHLDGRVTMNKSVDGSYNGPFITFCRAACAHFLPPGFVNGPTLDQAVIWVATGPQIESPSP